MRATTAVIRYGGLSEWMRGPAACGRVRAEIKAGLERLTQQVAYV